MPSPIEILPAELFLRVVGNLRHHDLAVLMRVSHGFNALVEPLLWTRIEFHGVNFHEHYIHKQLRDEEFARQRPYNTNPEDRPLKKSSLNGVYYDTDEEKFEKVVKFLRTIQDLESQDSARAKHLKGLVRWLCLPVDKSIFTDGHYVRSEDIRNLEEKDIWNTLASFTSIEYFELSAYWTGPYNTVPFRHPAQPLPNLHTLRLRGYVPLDFAKYMLESAPTITEMQLGILDAPISTMGECNPPPPVPEKYKHLSEEELWELDVDDYEDFSTEYTAPRPLPCLSPEIALKFASLTKLYLCRPCDPGDDELCMTHSKRSAQRILNEWVFLLRATQKTLVHLTFDHRPATEENAPDGTTNTEFMRYYCNGPGYHEFVETVLAVLLELEWPALKIVWLFGFEWDGREVDDEDSPPHAYECQGVDLPGQLKNRLPTVEVHSALGRRMIIWNDDGETISGGDVLDCGNGFSDDEED